MESWKEGGGEGGGEGGRVGGRGERRGGKKILFLSGTLYCSHASLRISGETRKNDVSSLYAS